MRRANPQGRLRTGLKSRGASACGGSGLVAAVQAVPSSEKVRAVIQAGGRMAGGEAEQRRVRLGAGPHFVPVPGVGRVTAEDFPDWVVRPGLDVELVLAVDRYEPDRSLTVAVVGPITRNGPMSRRASSVGLFSGVAKGGRGSTSISGAVAGRGTSAASYRRWRRGRVG